MARGGFAHWLKAAGLDYPHVAGNVIDGQTVERKRAAAAEPRMIFVMECRNALQIRRDHGEGMRRIRRSRPETAHDSCHSRTCLP